MRCGVDVAALRAAPSDAAEQVSQALRDEPLEIERRDGEWALVVTAYDYRGWVPTSVLAGGDGAFPAASAASPLEAARRFVGAPYEWGGMTAAGIDCSGLVHVAFRLAGRLVPRDAWQQEAAATAVRVARPGDLVFYGEPAGRADHVAFWAGGGRILHATGRSGLGAVEEREPSSLRARRRSIGRL